MLFITQIFKTLNPYFRKHILDSLEIHEYMIINTFFVATFVFIYFLYKIIFHDHSFEKLVKKVEELSILQVVFFIIIGFVTLCSSIVFIHMDKYYNTPFINGILAKGMSALLLMAVGIFMFKEEYTYMQIFGVFLTIIGLYFVVNKGKK